MRRILCAVLIMVPLSVRAGMYGPEYQTCTGHSTTDTVECLGQLTAKWDDFLNASYRALKDRGDSRQVDALTVAQPLWLAYRDANCTFYATGDGTITQILSAACMRAMTKHRACELHAALRMEGVPPGPCD